MIYRFNFIKKASGINKKRQSPPTSRATRGQLHHIEDGFREEQSETTQWQNLYLGTTIMVLGAGFEEAKEYLSKKFYP